VSTASPEFDVAIVGYGPVGQALAVLLGDAGFRVAVFEQWPTLYPLPRACVIDHEIMRVLQQVGVAKSFSEMVVPTAGEYVWLNAKGETLYHFKYGKDGISGWPARTLMYQPDLERLLHDRVRSIENIELNQGWQAIEYQLEHNTGTLLVQMVVPDQNGGWLPGQRTRRIRARYVVGADGANSFVRSAAGMTFQDLGFRADWLVIDYRPHRPEIALDMPEAGQICDPARPITLMRHMGRRHVRWEVMLLPGETAAEMTIPSKVWSLIERWAKPEEGVIDRAAVYTFRSGLADTWVTHSAILAGDAAHLMPPFLGQGLCSGLRDSLSLFWRLKLILRGLAGPGLLKSYEEERKGHVAAVISRAVALGKVVCITDPREAARRDAEIIQGTAPGVPDFPKLETGLLHSTSTGEIVPPAGLLSLQARVAKGDVIGLFDDVVGSGWCVLTLDEGLEAQLSAEIAGFLRDIGMQLFTFRNGDGGLLDVDGRYHAFMDALGVRALIVRPDFYIYAAAASIDEVPTMLDELRRRLTAEWSQGGDRSLSVSCLEKVSL
jgi:2-polyprenyl-6-methoxyphenol hydroxylase-like FAD-dependent oxidoreductase